MLLACAPVALSKEKPKTEVSPDALLDKAVKNPGGYSQMCDIQFVEQYKVPVPLYGLSLDTEFELSKDTLFKLRAQRDGVIAALNKRLSGIDFSKAPKTAEIKFAKDSEKLVSSGLDPKYLSQILLKIIIDLNATECLPELQRLEKILSAKLEANHNDPKSSLPEFQNDAGFVVGNSKDFEADFEKRNGKEPTAAEQAAQDAVHKRVAAIVAQRDLLATMLCLLRQERYPALIESDWEKQVGKDLLEKSKEENFAGIKKPEDIKEEDKEYVGWDPIHNVVCYPGRKVTDLKYTAEVREKTLGLVDSFLKEVPADKRKGASGMAAVPYVH